MLFVIAELEVEQRRYITIPYNTMQYHAVQYNTMQYSTIRYHLGRYTDCVIIF